MATNCFKGEGLGESHECCWAQCFNYGKLRGILLINTFFNCNLYKIISTPCFRIWWKQKLIIKLQPKLKQNCCEKQKASLKTKLQVIPKDVILSLPNCPHRRKTTSSSHFYANVQPLAAKCKFGDRFLQRDLACSLPSWAVIFRRFGNFPLTQEGSFKHTH